MFSPHKIIMCYIGVVVSGRKVFGRIIDAIKMFYNGPEWQLAGQLLEMFIWSALQHCASLHFQKLLGMPLDFEKVISEQFPQYKLSQHANMLAAFFIHVTSFTLVLKNHSFGGTHSEADTAQRALKIRLHFFLRKLMFFHIFTFDFFLPSMDSRLIRFKSSMVTLFADSQSVLSCSKAAFFTCG